MPPVQDRLKTGPPPRAHDAPSPAERSAPHAAQRPSDQQEASSLPSTPRAAVPGSDRGNPAPPSAGDPLSAGSKTGREKIFDRDVLAKLTEPTPQSRQQDKGITFDTSEFKYYGYLQRLKEKIESIWRYPQGAAEQGIYGDLYVRFTIMKSGKLGAVELVRTSGYRALDEAAMKALWDAQPYWPLPNEWGREGFTITGHFIYTLHGVYIR
jgi:protein TonB